MCSSHKRLQPFRASKACSIQSVINRDHFCGGQPAAQTHVIIEAKGFKLGMCSGRAPTLASPPQWLWFHCDWGQVFKVSEWRKPTLLIAQIPVNIEWKEMLSKLPRTSEILLSRIPQSNELTFKLILIWSWNHILAFFFNCSWWAPARWAWLLCGVLPLQNTVGTEGLQKVVGPGPAVCGVTQTFCMFPGEYRGNSRLSCSSMVPDSCMFCGSHPRPNYYHFVVFKIVTNVLCFIYFSFSKAAEPSCCINSFGILKRCGFSPQSHSLPILSQSQFSSQWFSALPEDSP